MARISVVGLGKLGACLAAVYSSKGHQVVGIDINESSVTAINDGRAPVRETGLQAMMNKHPFKASTSYTAVKPTDVTFVIVPTPSDKHGRFSNEYVLQAVREIGKAITLKKRYHLVVICSTTMPGSTDGVIREALEEASGKVVGDRLGLCFSPEFIALGSVIHDMLSPDMVLIGESDPIAGDKLETLIHTIVKAPVRRLSITNAEIAKIAVNTFVTMKISYANTLAEICENLPGGDATQVANAVGLDARIGRKYLTPGTAYGGPCFPRDTVAFAALATELGLQADLAEATGAVNERQAARLADMVAKYCPPNGTVGILGIAYKPDTAIIDESPGAALGNILKQRDFHVKVYDPVVIAGKTNFAHTTKASDCLKEVSVAILMTPCSEFRSLTPKCFEDNPDLILIDCWDLTERGPWDDLNVIRLGRAI